MEEPTLEEPTMEESAMEELRFRRYMARIQRAPSTARVQETEKHQGTMQPFRFFDLPPEIRSIILRMALQHERQLQHATPYFRYITGYKLLEKDPNCQDVHLIENHLLATSHQMRAEALAIFLACNTFRWTIDPRYDDQPIWIMDIGNYANTIRSVHLQVHIRGWNGFSKLPKMMAPMIHALELCSKLRSLKITVVVDRLVIESYAEKALDPKTLLSTAEILELFAGVAGHKEALFAIELQRSTPLNDHRLQQLLDMLEAKNLPEAVETPKKKEVRPGPLNISSIYEQAVQSAEGGFSCFNR